MKGFKIALFVVVSICFFISLRSVDLSGALPAIRRTGSGFFLLMAVTFIAYYCGAIGWKYCFIDARSGLSTFKLFLVRHAGETIGLLNPTGTLGAEAAKMYFLRKSGISGEKVLASLLSSRAIMVLSHLALFVPIVAYLSVSGMFTVDQLQIARWMLYAALGCGLAGTCIASLIFLVKRKRKETSRPWIKKIAAQLRGTSATLKSMLIHHRRALLLAFGFFLLHWIIGGLEFYFILKLLKINVNPAQALVVDLGVMFFKIAGTVIPGQIGIEEYGNKLMLSLIGITADEIWITASVLRRLRQVAWILSGLAIYFVLSRTNVRLNASPDGDLIRQS